MARLEHHLEMIECHVEGEASFEMTGGFEDSPPISACLWRFIAEDPQTLRCATLELKTNRRG